uniref:SWIM-type domain-containing protein n=1 Tax=Lactuca sativa TaxID=4236 RepID=A0A9R1WEY1_LACSA|nr:hypothetical protein LSAT_V11C200084130 [Lactuca sativa]
MQSNGLTAVTKLPLIYPCPSHLRRLSVDEHNNVERKVVKHTLQPQDGHPTLFTIKLYHGGEFTKYPDVRYIDGTVNYVDMVDIDEFSVHELDAIMKGFRYGVPPVIYYHFLVPGGDFHFGLRPLGNDQDVANFSQYVSEHKVMKVYIEHGETRLLTYFLNPKPVTKVTLVQLDEPHEDVQHIDEAPEDQSKETPVMTTPTDNLVDVVPTQANQPKIQVNEIVQVVSLSPGYNRRRGMSKDGVMNTRKVRAATTKFMSKQIMDQVESNPTIPVKALQEQLQKKYGVGFSIHKVFRAKADAKKIYEVLRDYILELQSTNPDTTVKLELGDVSESNLVNCTSRCFKRIYVCLGGMKKGFKACLRDFLGLDGAHMKGPYPGQILTTVGLDSNNGIYPLAYAIVEIENCESWKWFLECLGDDLDLHAMYNFTFVSDRQKGLLQAVSQLFPCAEHRFCLRHIHENMKKQWRTKEYKDHLWDCATATTVPEFNHFMHQFSLFDKSAYEWLKSIPPQHWAKSHFTGRATTDMLLNNLCEVFNGKLVDGRDKPIISCLEFIREYMMKRICNVLRVQQKCLGPLTPTATKIMEKNEAAATQYIVEWCGDEKYQVKGPWNDQHVVDMHERVCNCRKWELTGIPCRHVISVLYNKADHGECVQELHTYVHKVHWLQTWKTAYGYKVEPIKGRAMWPRSECPMQITPPPHRNQPGRPKRKRRQSMEEKSQSKSQSQSQRSDVGPSEIHGHGPHGGGKLTRKFVSVTCSKCGNKGHNSRTCKGQGGT